jgi:hypothetical protein
VAYNVYETKQNITLLACMAHTRRKFDQAKYNAPVRASYTLAQMQTLYRVESKAREQGLSHDQRKEIREKESLPVLKKLKKWLTDQLPEVLPKSAIGKAITYTLSLWKRLTRYVENGQWVINNNLVENSIRPVALGYVKLSITWAERIICLPGLMRLHSRLP